MSSLVKQLAKRWTATTAKQQPVRTKPYMVQPSDFPPNVKPYGLNNKVVSLAVAQSGLIIETTAEESPFRLGILPDLPGSAVVK